MTPRWPFVLLLVGVAVLGMRGPDSANPATAEPDADLDRQVGVASSGLGAASDPDLPSPEPTSTWYCGAGTVGGVADHTVIVSNPGDEAVDGTLKLFSQEAPDDRIWGADAAPGDARESHAISVPARDELEVVLADLDDSVIASATATESEAFVAALLEFEADVTVEHKVKGDSGGSQGPCAVGGSSEWHFAWGATTRDARDLMVLFNPFPNDVVVDASFVTDEGVREPVDWQGLVVPAGRVVVVDVGDDVTRRERVAASIRARSGSLIVERLHVFDGSGEAEGLWLAAGHPSPLTRAVFPADALDGGNNELVAFYNPGPETAEVDVQVKPDEASDAAEPIPFRLVVRPRQVRVLDFAEESRIPAGQAHVTEVVSTNQVPVVAQQVVLSSPE